MAQLVKAIVTVSLQLLSCFISCAILLPCIAMAKPSRRESLLPGGECLVHFLRADAKFSQTVLVVSKALDNLDSSKSCAQATVSTLLSNLFSKDRITGSVWSSSLLIWYTNDGASSILSIRSMVLRITWAVAVTTPTIPALMLNGSDIGIEEMMLLMS
jgi:hypothetical protein